MPRPHRNSHGFSYGMSQINGTSHIISHGRSQVRGTSHGKRWEPREVPWVVPWEAPCIPVGSPKGPVTTTSGLVGISIGATVHPMGNLMGPSKSHEKFYGKIDGSQALKPWPSVKRVQYSTCIQQVWRKNQGSSAQHCGTLVRVALLCLPSCARAEAS